MLTTALSDVLLLARFAKIRIQSGFERQNACEPYPKPGGNTPMEASEQPLQGQIAVVTGGGRGIGRAISQRLAALGATVVLCGRTREPLDRTAADIHQVGGRSNATDCDVTRLESVERLAKYVDSNFGRLDVLVNNAGVSGVRVPLHEFPPEVWDEVMNTNLRGVYFTIRSLTPLMLRSGGGHIINISSLAGKNPLPNGACYAASKWGLNGLSYAVAEELRAKNIRVSVICPGSTLSEWEHHGGKDLKKILLPDDVAHAVAMIVTQAPQSFISEVLLRPTQKPK
jgi:NAD(P)-dependent dehydrogenase (short-subunit alcohol dehydrogenase family)